MNFVYDAGLRVSNCLQAGVGFPYTSLSALLLGIVTYTNVYLWYNSDCAHSISGLCKLRDREGLKTALGHHWTYVKCYLN